MSVKEEPLPALTFCASMDPNSLPNESNQIVVTLPARFGKIATASILDLAAPQSQNPSLRLETRPQTENEPMAEAADQQLTFVNPDPAELTLRTLDRFLVQLWDERGELVADLPFARLPGEP